MQLAGLILVHRIMPLMEVRFAEERYAFRRARSAEVWPSDLDHCVAVSRGSQKLAYVGGLDIAGAFASASRPKLI